MVSALDYGSSRPGSSLGLGRFVAFLSKIIYFCSASRALRPGAPMGTVIFQYADEGCEGGVSSSKKGRLCPETGTLHLSDGTLWAIKWRGKRYSTFETHQGQIAHLLNYIQIHFDFTARWNSWDLFIVCESFQHFSTRHANTWQKA